MSDRQLVPALPLQLVQATDTGNAAAASSGRIVLSSSRTKYSITPRGEHGGAEGGDGQTMTPRMLREISKFIDMNKKLGHSHRSGNVSTLIPKIPFQRVLENVDSVVKLAIAAVHPSESALDIPLRLMTPAAYHAPEMRDPRSNSTIATRIVALLKGATSVPVHWKSEKEGTERDVSKLNALRDAEMRARAAHRAQHFIKEAAAYCCLGAMHYNACNTELAVDSFGRAAHLFEQIGDGQGVAYCHNILGVCYYRLGEYKMALLHHKKQEVLVGNYGRAVAQLNLGVCYSALSEIQFAEQAFNDALVSALEARDPVLEAIALGNLGLTYMRAGDMRRSQTHMERCLEHCSIAGDKVGAAVCLLLLGEIYSIVGDNEHALFYYEHSLRVADEVRCSDIAEIARVSVGVARGSQAVKNSLVAMANKMGQKFAVEHVLASLAKN